MREVGVLEAKTRLSALLDEIERTGEAIVITRHGKPIARLSPERAKFRWTKEAIEEHLRWRAEIGRQAEARGAEPFDWKEAVEEGRE
ncbi:MAG: type II toxin-antitoxin system Phd/YefM family antitoxin [Proteobacteria bacterium]|nr:type II toxin-antitoxin system Phd/YefM family antitoxin [Pseudomonadota bacterium]